METLELLIDGVKRELNWVQIEIEDKFKQVVRLKDEHNRLVEKKNKLLESLNNYEVMKGRGYISESQN